MNSFSIFKIEIKKHFGSILKISGLLSLFMLLILWMFDPELFGEMDEMMKNYPQGILDMMGSVISLSTLSGFITMEFLAMIWMWVGISIILKAAQDIPTEIDDKTMDLILSKPIKRWEYALGKQLRFIFTLLFIFSSMLLTVAICVPILPNLADESVEWNEYIAAFFWAFLFCLALESTAFLFSTFMPRKKATSAAFSALILFMICGLYYGYFDESMQDMKYISLFYYYDPGRIMISHNFVDVGRDVAVLLIYSITLTTIAVIVFDNRDIPV